MGQKWQNLHENVAAEIDTFLIKDLLHHNAGAQSESDGYFVKTAIELYYLVKLSDGKNTVDMDTVKNILVSFTQKTEPLRFSTAHANHRV